MKKNYKRIGFNRGPYYGGHIWLAWELSWESKHYGRYSLRHSYFRSIATFNERRQNRGAIADGYHVRGKRRKLPTSWDDARISRDWGRSWKDYTKKGKQWA